MVLFEGLRNSLYNRWSKLRRKRAYARETELVIYYEPPQRDLEQGSVPRLEMLNRVIPSTCINHAYGSISYSFTCPDNNDNSKSLVEIRKGENTTLAALHEGHGDYGRQTAEYLCTHLFTEICSKTIRDGPNLTRRTQMGESDLKRAFGAIEDGLKQELVQGNLSSTSGCSSLVLLIKRDAVMIANVGDTRLLVSRPYKLLKVMRWGVVTQKLSQEHNLEDKTACEEFKERLGAPYPNLVTEEGVLAFMNGRTKLTRCLGHFRLKDSEHSETPVPVPIVRSDPYLATMPKEIDTVYVLASKIVFSIFTDDEIGKIINSRCPAYKQDIAQWLIKCTLKEGVARGLDILESDIAVVVVFVEALEKVHPASGHSTTCGTNLEDHPLYDE